MSLTQKYTAYLCHIATLQVLVMLRLYLLGVDGQDIYREQLVG
ncbi:hypothetical protein [Celerinatantimonas diazotrophica]|nr:hypothetical protein [Celerinatantimonas diazotrophica]